MPRVRVIIQPLVRQIVYAMTAVLLIFILLSTLKVYQGFDVLLSRYLTVPQQSLAPYLVQTGELSSPMGSLMSGFISLTTITGSVTNFYDVFSFFLVWMIVALIYLLATKKIALSLLLSLATFVITFLIAGRYYLLNNTNVLNNLNLFFIEILLVFVSYFASLYLSGIFWKKSKFIAFLLLGSIALGYCIILAFSVPPLSILYLIWFFVLVLPVGILAWLSVSIGIGSMSPWSVRDILMSMVFGTIFLCLVSWFLLQIGAMTLPNLVLLEVASIVALLLFVKKRALLKLRSIRIYSLPTFESSLILAITLSLVFVLEIGWFNVSFNQIPWLDAWMWWGQGLSSAFVGKVWDVGYLSIGNSPPVQSLLGSVFSLHPDVISSIYFMKIFSLFLIFFTSLLVFFLSGLLLSKIPKLNKDLFFVRGFSVLCFMTTSWVLFYAVTFVRELLGIPILVMILCLMNLNARNTRLQFFLCICLSIFVFFVSPLTAFYSSFLAGILFLVLIVKLKDKSSSRLYFLLSLLLAVILAFFLVMALIFPLAPGVPSLFTSIHFNLISPSQLVYFLINGGGLLSFVFAALGLWFILFRAKSNISMFISVLFFAFILLITFVFPITDVLYQHAEFFGIAVSILSPIGIIAVLDLFERNNFFGKKITATNRRAIVLVLLFTILIAQFSYGFAHASNIDRTNESEVVNLLMNLNNEIPSNAIVLVDGPLVYKSLGFLAPRDVQTWGLIKAYQDAISNTTTLLNLIDFSIRNNVYFVSVSGGDYFLDNLRSSVLVNIDVVLKNYSVSMDYLGTPFMLTYGYRDVYLFNFSYVVQIP